MSLSGRQNKILSLINSQKRVRVDDLAEVLSTTPQTIRRDLQQLAELHHVVRFHGGAALLGGVEYTDFAARRDVARAEKQAIGALVAQLIPNNCAIFINAGTTTECVAQELRGHAGLRLITDNVDIAAKTREFPGVEVIVPGGTVRGSDGAILGAEAVDYIRQFRVDYAVIGAAALDENGTLLDYDLQEVQVCRAIMANARHIILAIDSGKFDRSAPVRLGDLSQIHTMVTDDGIKNRTRELCDAADVELRLTAVRNRRQRRNRA